MPSKPKTMKTFDDLTEKQVAFVNALVADWGVISKPDSGIEYSGNAAHGKVSSQVYRCVSLGSSNPIH